MKHDLPRSKGLYETASRFVTGGVHSGFRYKDPHPLYFAKAIGPRIWDVDGNEYLDLIVTNGACILGHRDPGVTRSVKRYLDDGIIAGVESELSVEVGRRLHEMVPCAEAVKFANSGTEAVLHALQIARGYSKRKKILKFEGCYHGWGDEMQIGVHPALEGAVADAGTRMPPYESETVIVLPFNDPDALERTVRQRRNELAAVIVEAVVFNSGCILPKPGYLQEVRRITKENDVLLIFDEVITGFRLAPGGAQEYFGVTPDMATFAKAIANGYPLGAVAGRREVMEVTSPGGRVLYAGTYNGSYPSLAAAKETLTRLKSGSVNRHLHRATKQLQRGFNDLAHDKGIGAQLIGLGGEFQPFFTEEEIVNYRDTAKSDQEKFHTFYQQMLDAGVLFHGSQLFHHGVTKSHRREDIDHVIEAFDTSLSKIK
jgi:glutamate-1-semialdehyde 2,1-aminomutase